MLGILTLLVFSFGGKYYNLEVARTMAFVTLGLIEMVHSFNIRSDESIFKCGVFKNKYLCLAFILGLIMQVGIVILPSIRGIFSLAPLNGIQWLFVAGVSLVPVVVMELQKKLNELVFGKPVYDYKEVRQ